MPTSSANIAGSLSNSWITQPVPGNVTDPETFKAARGFESYFAQYMVKQMQGSTSLVGGKGFGGDIYNSMYTEVLGDQLAGQGALGVTDMIYRQLMQQQGIEPYSEEASETSPSLYQSPSADLMAQMNANIGSSTAQFEALANDAAERYNLDPRLIRAVIRAESGWDSTAVSSAGAMGLMQLMPETATGLGVQDAFDAEQNIDGGARYLKQMLDRYDGELPVALAAYNAGPTAVDEHGGVPPFEETQEYVQKILSWLAMSGSAEPLIREEATTRTAREFLNNPENDSQDGVQTAGEEPWKPS